MSVHIRLARPEDLAALSLLATRAFAEDAVIAYLADARAYPSPPPASASSVRELDNRQRLLYYFLDGLARGTLVTQGRIVVVTVDERIVASAYWTRPGAKIDSLPVILKSKQYRGVLGDSRSLFRGWGVRGFIRAVFEYQARVDAIQKVQCRKRGSDKDQCWHLQLICSDPDAQGKGYSGMLMREHFSFVPDAALVLEASSPKSRDIYLHYGFEITGELAMGKGKVGADGLRSGGGDVSPKCGAPVWTMFRSAQGRTEQAQEGPA